MLSDSAWRIEGFLHDGLTPLIWWPRNYDAHVPSEKQGKTQTLLRLITFTYIAIIAPLYLLSSTFLY
jgi:hypothetical protein